MFLGSKLSEELLNDFVFLFPHYLKYNNNVERACAFWPGNAHKSFIVVVVFCEWGSELTSARHHENSRTIPPAASQSILLSKTSAKSASSCQSNQSSNLSGGGGAVKPRRKSLRQTFANTNFDKNSTQEYLPKYKKKYKCMWNESYKISRFLKSCVSACTPVELDTLHHFTPCPMLPWNI